MYSPVEAIDHSGRVLQFRHGKLKPFQSGVRLERRGLLRLIELVRVDCAEEYNCGTGEQNSQVKLTDR
jgi:hypothetical protein